MLSFKFLLISAIALSAVVLKFPISVNLVEFALNEVLSIYNDVVSWFRPLYVYLFVNCIILTIVASSKLKLLEDDDVSPPLVPEILVEVRSIESEYKELIDSDSTTKEEKIVEFGYVERETTPLTVVNRKNWNSNKENEFVIKNDWTYVSPSYAARFDHQSNLKTPQGNKTVLGELTLKPNRQDAKETMKKINIWERENNRGRKSPQKMMTKTETFKDRANIKRPLRSPSPVKSDGGSASRKQQQQQPPSPSQDELKLRVEAFIKKFNNDIRKQRLESLIQSKGTNINRSTNY